MELSRLLIDDSIKVGAKNHQPPKFSKHQLRNLMGGSPRTSSDPPWTWSSTKSRSTMRAYLRERDN